MIPLPKYTATKREMAIILTPNVLQLLQGSATTHKSIFCIRVLQHCKLSVQKHWYSWSRSHATTQIYMLYTKLGLWQFFCDNVASASGQTTKNVQPPSVQIVLTPFIAVMWLHFFFISYQWTVLTRPLSLVPSSLHWIDICCTLFIVWGKSCNMYTVYILICCMFVICLNVGCNTLYILCMAKGSCNIYVYVEKYILCMAKGSCNISVYM